MKERFKKVKDILGKKSPEILLGVGLVGIVATAVLAAVGATKTKEELDEKEQNTEETVDKKEIVKVYAKNYAPAAAVGAVTIFCIVRSHVTMTRRLISVTEAYTLADKSFKLYQQKVKEALSGNKEEAVKDAVAKEELAQNPMNQNNFIPTNGDVLCYDCLSGRYFRSTINKIQKVVNTVNDYMKSEVYISLNEFYDYLGLRHIDIGDELGWSAGKYIDIRFSSIISGDDAPTGEGVPCLMLEYLVGPRYDYRDNYSGYGF